MKRSITVPMKAEGITTMRILYDYKTETYRMEALKEWEPDFRFEEYNKTFYAESIMTDDVVYYNTKQVEALFEKYELGDYLNDIKTLLYKGKHFGIEAYYHAGKDILYMSNQHSRKLGINNKMHATLAGGIRRHGRDEDEIDVIIDGLNLGRGMSFKNVAGRINMGGCKQTVTMDPIDLEDMEAVGFLGFAIDRCRTMTGPDMNFPTELADVENEFYSMQYTNGPRTSKLGETGKPTAYGVYITLKAAMKYKEGNDSLAGKTYTLIGLGAVGWYMGECLLREDIGTLYVTDLYPARAQQFIDEHPGRDIVAISLEGAYLNKCDVLVPCAIGGYLDEELIANVNCKYIWGSANNGLKALSAEEEIALAEMLKARDITFQVEWWHNTAGVICGYHEYVYGQDATEEKLYKDIDDIMPASTYNNLKQADELGITAVENAYRVCDAVIYGDVELKDI